MISEYFASVGIKVNAKEIAKVDKLLSGVESRLKGFKNTANIFSDSGIKKVTKAERDLAGVSSKGVNLSKDKVKTNKAETKSNTNLAKSVDRVTKSKTKQARVTRSKLPTSRYLKSNLAWLPKDGVATPKTRYSGIFTPETPPSKMKPKAAKSVAATRNTGSRFVKDNLSWLPKDGVALPKTRYSGIFTPNIKQDVKQLTPKQQAANKSNFFRSNRVIDEAVRLSAMGVPLERSRQLAQGIVSKREALSKGSGGKALKGRSTSSIVTSQAYKDFMRSHLDPNRKIPIYDRRDASKGASGDTKPRKRTSYIGERMAATPTPNALKGFSPAKGSGKDTWSSYGERGRREKILAERRKANDKALAADQKSLEIDKERTRLARERAKLASRAAKRIESTQRKNAARDARVARSEAGGANRGGSGSASRGRGGSRGGLSMGLFGGGAIASAGSLYGLGRLNKANQEAMLAPLTTQAVFTAAGDTEEAGTKSWNWFKALGDDVGFDYVKTAPQFNSFMSNAKAADLETEQSQDFFQSISEYSTAMGVSAYRKRLVLTGVSQMLGKNQVQAQELKLQVAESLPGTMAIFAEANALQKGSGLTGQAAYSALLADMQGGNVKTDTLVPYLKDIFTRKAAPKLEVLKRTSVVQQERAANARNRAMTAFSENGGEEGFYLMWKNLTKTWDASIPLVKTLAGYFKSMVDTISMIPLNMLTSLNNIVDSIKHNLMISDSMFKNISVSMLGMFALATKIGRRFAAIGVIVASIEELLAIFGGNGEIRTLSDVIVDMTGLNPDGLAAKWVKFGTAVASVVAIIASMRVLTGFNPLGKMRGLFGGKGGKGIAPIGGGKVSKAPTPKTKTPVLIRDKATGKVRRQNARDLADNRKTVPVGTPTKHNRKPIPPAPPKKGIPKLFEKVGKISTKLLGGGLGLVKRLPLITAAFAAFDSLTTSFEDKLKYLNVEGDTFLGSKVNDFWGSLKVLGVDFSFRFLNSLTLGLFDAVRNDERDPWGVANLNKMINDSLDKLWLDITSSLKAKFDQINIKQIGRDTGAWFGDLFKGTGEWFGRSKERNQKNASSVYDTTEATLYSAPVGVWRRDALDSMTESEKLNSTIPNQSNDNTFSITIDGAGDPTAVAHEVARQINGMLMDVQVGYA